MTIIGHRGSSAVAPENTLASFARAWTEGADGVELDVRVTRDGHVVVHHDATTWRTTGFDALVADTPWDVLQKLDAGSWKGPPWSGERIPELADVLRMTPPGKKVFVEVKCGVEILPALGRVVAEGGLEAGQVAFVGFSPDTMQAVKETFPAHKAFLNVERGMFFGRKAAEAVAVARARNLDGIGPGIGRTVEVEALALMIREGLEVFAWTVDDMETARVLRDVQVHYLVTNRPGELRRQLARFSRRRTAP